MLALLLNFAFVSYSLIAEKRNRERESNDIKFIVLPLVAALGCSPSFSGCYDTSTYYCESRNDHYHHRKDFVVVVVVVVV
mgnify:CR=1 FL=1